MSAAGSFYGAARGCLRRARALLCAAALEEGHGRGEIAGSVRLTAVAWLQHAEWDRAVARRLRGHARAS